MKERRGSEESLVSGQATTGPSLTLSSMAVFCSMLLWLVGVVTAFAVAAVATAVAVAAFGRTIEKIKQRERKSEIAKKDTQGEWEVERKGET